MASAAALALALAGCGSTARPSHPATRAAPPAPPPSTSPSVAADGNPVPTARDIQLPASGTTAIPVASAPRGGPVSCTAHGPIYTESRPTRRRVVALSFDDGPSGFTRRILQILERKRVHATFFVIGNQVRDHPDLLRRELRDGDIVGDHTWTHADMTLLSPTVQRQQIALTLQAIKAATGFDTCLWRAPYGAVSGRIEGLARSLGLLSIQWDTDPQDFAMPPVAAIVWRVLHGNPANPDRGVHPGAIVLMHDGGGDRSHTVAALPTLIDQLRARGYSFVTVPELLGLRVTRRP